MRILFIVLLSVIYSCQGVSQTMEGRWKGDLEASGKKIPLLFAISKENNWTVKMKSPSQAQMDFNMDSVSVNGDSIFIKSSALGLSFAGKLQESGEAIVGKYSQRGFTAPLTLTRYEGEKAERRTQQPMNPLPYESKQVAFTNDRDEVRLAGTMTQPAQPGKYPAVILVSGSGPQNRNSEVFGHKPFEVIADYLTRKGIVVLRYDDRGVAESTGSFVKSNIGDFSRDAMAALSFIKRQDKVDSTRLGIIGHSEGGLISLLLAGQHIPDLKFAVSLAGPSVAIDSLMVLQLYHVGKSQGMSEADLSQARTINRKNFEIVKSEIPAPEALNQLMKNTGALTGTSEELRKEFQVMVLEPYRYFLRIDPVPFIRRINIPLLAVFGEKDIQVPAIENQASLSANLPANAQSRIKTYPSLNHLMQPAKTGALDEYYEIETTIEPQLLEDISKWILGMKN
ncbi:alpha/beta hydrolase family protein [Sphingobacterium corticis]|uniref:Alpha/beta hydrolase family protein n=1 Tax=Sphingobacterium corticis TaxID=1812823 RepID=A0ABW5NJ16_9SPHI